MELNRAILKIMSHLIPLTLIYIQFMSNLGNLSNRSYLNQLPELFSETITKVENGRVIVRGQTALLKQLENARNYAAP